MALDRLRVSLNVILFHTADSVGQADKVDPDVTRQVINVKLRIVTRLVFMMYVDLSSVDDHVVADDDSRVVRPFTRH